MQRTADIVQLNRSHLKLVSETCADAFLNDPQAVHLLPKQHERKRLLPHIFKFMASYGILYGKAYAVSPDLEGIAVWLPSEANRITPLKLLRAGFFPLYRKVGMKVIVKLISFVHHSLAMQKNNASQDQWQLFILAVNPLHQGKGHASVLLNAMLKRMDSEHLACYLETHSEKNVNIYRRYGFKVVHSGPIPRTSLNVWTMLRTAS